MTLEAGSKVAAATVEGFKGHPLVLALVVINVLFLLAGGWFFYELAEATKQSREASNKLMHSLLERSCADAPKHI